MTPKAREVNLIVAWLLAVVAAVVMVVVLVLGMASSGTDRAFLRMFALVAFGTLALPWALAVAAIVTLRKGKRIGLLFNGLLGLGLVLSGLRSWATVSLLHLLVLAAGLAVASIAIWAARSRPDLISAAAPPAPSAYPPPTTGGTDDHRD